MRPSRHRALLHAGADEPLLTLSTTPITIGSDPACAVVVPDAAPIHARISADSIEALAPCEVGHVPLIPGSHRLLVGGARIVVAQTSFIVRDEESTEERALPTRELALRMVADPAFFAPTVSSVLVVEGPSRGEERTVSPRIRIGRASDAELRLADDADASREHLEVLVRDGVVLVRDLASTTGSFLGTRRLPPTGEAAVWEPEFMLRVGSSVLALVLPDAMRARATALRALADGAREKAPAPVADTATVAHAPAAAPAPNSLVRAQERTAAPMAEIVLQEGGAKPSKRAGRSVERAVPVFAALAFALGIAALVWVLR